jgi:carboxypeptidase family protein/TonB-dependent receptor-like protein
MRRLPLAWSALLLIIGAPPVSAQTTGTMTGAISGTVTDATGGVIRNVTVTVSSDALMVPRVVLTGDDGQYRITAIPAGTYQVVFTHEGFRTATSDRVLVGTGVTVTVSPVLDPDSVKDHVTVTAESRLLDRHTTGITTHYTAEELASLPNSRTVFAILSATPAIQVARIEVGGASGDAGAAYAAYGTAGSNRPTVEGINVSGMFPLGFTLDYGAFDEVTVYTAAHGAEWSAPGVHMQMTSKSGGNTYRGTFYGDYEHRDWQSFNIDADQISRGAAGTTLARSANRLWSYYDVSADAGGFIKRDRVWWYASVRNQDVSLRQVNFSFKPLRTELTNLSSKLNARLSGNHTLIGYGQLSRNHRPNRLDPFGAGGLTAASAQNQSEADTLEQRARGLVWKAEWNGIFGETLFVETHAGRFDADRFERPYSDAPRYEDPGNLNVSGGNRDWQESHRRPQITGSATYVVDGWLGEHQVKAGGEILYLLVSEIWRRSYPGDVLHVLNRNAPLRVYLFQTPSRSESGLWIPSLYLTDAWRVSERLTLNIGLRFDRYRVFLPAQTHPASRFNATAQTFAAVNNLIAWNTVVPRLGAILDLDGHGRTIAKLVYGHYSIGPGTELGFNANPNARVWWELYPWSDSNGNAVWDPGEEDRTRPLGSRGGIEQEKVDAALDLPQLREAGTWLERELPGRIRLKTGVVWRSERQHYVRQNIENPPDEFTTPVLISDPGPDGLPGTGDEGPAIPGFEVGKEFLPIPQSFEVRNVPRADSRYWTWDLAADRRLNNRWSVAAGASVTWNAEEASAYLGQPVRQNPYPLNPNDLIHAGEDGRHEFTTWTFKAHGIYEAPWGLRVTPHLRHQSGQPFGRTIRTTLNYGEAGIPILVEPIGTRRTDNITVLDLRLEKAFRWSGRRFAGFLDVFNLFNGNPEQNVSFSSGTFLQPLSIVPPRIARIGARIDW